MTKHLYPLDFMEQEQIKEIIKNNIPEGAVLDKEDNKDYQIHFILSNKDRIIINYDENKHFQLNLTQCPRFRDKIYEKLEPLLTLKDCNTGMKKSKVWKLYSKSLSNKLKNQISLNYRKKVSYGGSTPTVYFVFRIKGKNALTHMKNGDLHLNIQRPNKITDDIYNFIEEFLSKNTESSKRVFEEIDVDKETFSTFLQKNAGLKILENFDGKVYDYLSGRDVLEIEDGLKIYGMLKEKDSKLRNYTTIVRNFSIAFEGFLIKYFLDIGYIDRDAYQQDSRNVEIYRCIERLRIEFKTIVERQEKGLISSLANIWNECRNSYLHSDMYSYSQLSNISQAESKIIEIFSTMRRLLKVLPLIKEGEQESIQSNMPS